jgi:homoserine O-succinyltransferase
MSVIIEGGRVPTQWLNRSTRAGIGPRKSDNGDAQGVRLAFINNMPDAALEDTELQFFELLANVSGKLPVYIKLYSLPGIVRADRGGEHLDKFYFGVNDIWQNQFDCVIITGTEPKQSNLREELYWNQLAEILDWAERNTNSTILSCLAAHASVLHSDGITRRRLPDKQCGVFHSTKTLKHHLTCDLPDTSGFPHSRWNEVREKELVAGGYNILTKSAEAGIDLFVKKKQKSLFVYFQGHPEYSAETLAKEYRRDVKRFLRGERESYPSMPHGYFNETTAAALHTFQHRAMADRGEDTMTLFPEFTNEKLENTWRSSAVCVYRNWLQYVMSKKAEQPDFIAVPDLQSVMQRKQALIR